jgi:hypothetical protein
LGGAGDIFSNFQASQISIEKLAGSLSPGDLKFAMSWIDGANNNANTKVGFLDGPILHWGPNISFISYAHALELVALTDTRYVNLYNNYSDNDTMYGTVFTVPVSMDTGSLTPTLYTPQKVSSSSYPVEEIYADKMTDTSFVVAFQDDQEGGKVKRVSTLVNLLITTMPEYAVANGGASDMDISSLDNTHFVIIYTDNNNSQYLTLETGQIASSGWLGTFSQPEIVYSSQSNRNIIDSFDSDNYVFLLDIFDVTNQKGFLGRGSTAPKNLQLQGINSTIYDTSNDYVASVSLDNNAIDLHYEDINGITKISNIITGTGISLLNGGGVIGDPADPPGGGQLGSIYFGYSVTSSPTEIHLVHYDLDERFIKNFGSTLIASNANFNAVFARDTYLNTPLIAYSETDGSLHVRTNGETYDLTGTNVEAIDAPMALAKDASNNFYLAYQNKDDLDLESVTFTLAGTSGLSATAKVNVTDSKSKSSLF